MLCKLTDKRTDYNWANFIGHKEKFASFVVRYEQGLDSVCVVHEWPGKNSERGIVGHDKVICREGEIGAIPNHSCGRQMFWRGQPVRDKQLDFACCA